MVTWWPWQTRQVPTYTSNTSGRAPGTCQRCNVPATVCLNGIAFYCWDHYCEEMEPRR